MTIALLARRGRLYNQPNPTAKLVKVYQARAEFYSLMNGEVAAHDIAKGNNLVPQAGAPTPSIVPWGKSLRFDGSASHLKSTYGIATLPTFTVMAWVRPAALNTFYTRIAETDYASGFYIGSNTASRYAFIVNNASLEGCIGGQQVIGQRDFICGTFDGTNRLLYVNGVLAGSSTATTPTSTAQLNIGRIVGSSIWNGEIDTVGVFNTVFSAGEILQFYQAPFRLFEPPRRYLGFNFSSGSTVTLTGANCTQANLSGTGAVTQAHILTGAASTQANLSSTGAITQTHVLVGTTSTQADLSSTGAITQATGLIGAGSSQTNLSATGAITQTHVLTGAAGVQANQCSAGAIIIGSTIVLTGAVCAQDNAASTGAITQTQVLTGAACTQANPSASGAISQVQVLVGAACTQGNATSTGVITTSQTLVGAASTQVNLGGVGQITRAQTLTGSNCTQVNLCSTGAWSTGIVFESALIAGDIAPPDNLIIKKPGIPTGTPDWEKTMFEIMTGRRGNAIPIPVQPALTFSATPTQAECQALFSYVNAVRDMGEKIVTRFDS